MTAAAAVRALRAYRPHRDDALIALAGAAGGLLLWSFGLTSAPALERGPRWLVLVPLAAMCLAALGRRTSQPYALILGILAEVADLLVGSLLATLGLFTDVLYAAVLYGSARLSRVVLRGSVVFTIVVSAGLLAAFQRADMLLIAGACGAVVLFPAWTGVIIRDHRDEAATERLRAEQTALLAEMDRTQAINAERSRMARELHDVVANHLSAIAIHSTAALSFQKAAPETAGGPDGPDGLHRAEGPDATGDATREALGVIRENSVQGLAEMRRLIGLLRDAEGADEPATTPPSTAWRPSWSGPAPRRATAVPSLSGTGAPRPAGCPHPWSWRPTASSRRRSPTRSSTPHPDRSPSNSTVRTRCT